MTPYQRAEALRLANSLDHIFAGWQGDVPAAAALLRSLAVEPEGTFCCVEGRLLRRLLDRLEAAEKDAASIDTAIDAAMQVRP